MAKGIKEENWTFGDKVGVSLCMVFALIGLVMSIVWFSNWVAAPSQTDLLTKKIEYCGTEWTVVDSEGQTATSSIAELKNCLRDIDFIQVSFN